MIPQLDWDAIKYQYQMILAALPDWQLPSLDEVDAHRVALSYPNLMSSVLDRKIMYGQMVAPDNRDMRPWVEDALTRLSLGGAELDPTFPNYRAIVEQCIERRELTLEFVDAWGRVCEAFGLLQGTMLLNQGSILEQFDKQQKAAIVQDRTLQRYWHAWWLKKAAADSDNSARLDAEAELAELCAKIRDGKCMPVQFGAGWFSTMLHANDGSVLATTYTRCPPAEIARMTENPLIGLEILPPLAPSAFPLA